MGEEFVFRADTHKYTVDGVRLPSVTEIVSLLGPDYNDFSGFERALANATERGIVCHHVLEHLLKGEDEPEYPDEYEPHIDAVRLFLSEHSITPYAMEMPMYSKINMIAGTPDLVCEFDGVLAVIDYKFVADISKIKTKIKAQLNGYLEILNDNGVFPDALYAVQFLPTGKYHIYDVVIENSELKHCLELYKAKNKKHPRGKIV